MTTRPLFHFTARSGWINDPHGITARDGGYDVFYQYVPGRTAWAPNCHWGHARGADLLSLVERDPALVPGDGDGGIWTGSLVTGPQGDRIFYTAVDVADVAVGRVRVAAPAGGEWDDWVKGDVVVEAPSGFEFVGFRDPFVRRDADAWRMFLGAGDADGRALALSYVSDDLDRWDYEGVALERSTTEREPAWTGAMWECPQIFEVDGRFVMLSSAWDRDVLNYAAYAIGSYNRGRFTAETWGRLTYGPSYYAPSYFPDAEGRPTISLWMRGVEDVDAGWAGAHSIPHLLSLDGDVLVARPHPDLERYRAAVDTALVAGVAADIEWQGAGRLSIRSGGRLLAEIDGDSAMVAVISGVDRWELPRAAPAIRVVVDAGVLEISSDRGVLGLAVESPSGGLQIDGEGATVFPLIRSEQP
jgi:beta-fructofuranosidase